MIDKTIYVTSLKGGVRICLEVTFHITIWAGNGMAGFAETVRGLVYKLQGCTHTQVVSPVTATRFYSVRECSRGKWSKSNRKAM